MKIENYAVAMNAQYFNLQQDHAQAKLSTTTQEFSEDDDMAMSKISVNSKQTNDATDELSMQLSKAILKNIDSEANRLVSDRVELSYFYNEVQSLNYQVDAYIQTDDREIELSLDISLSRSFTQKTNITIESLRALKDPLVISLDGTMPTLSSKTFAFDIDSDGESEQISQLNRGNAFLALDKNENGVVDDGNELFGTKSGDGFKDLSKYDDDKNGWIDENDAIFNKLRIWQKSDGKNELIALGEVGIGAIFLGNTATPFSLKSNSNELLAEIRKSGFVLFENGRAGIISQIDLALSPDIKKSIATIDEMQKKLSLLKLDNIYAKEPDKSENSNDNRMQKLQDKIKALEAKLTKADNDKKPVIQAQIGALFAQMMALLETEFN